MNGHAVNQWKEDVYILRMVFHGALFLIAMNILTVTNFTTTLRQNWKKNALNKEFQFLNLCIHNIIFFHNSLLPVYGKYKKFKSWNIKRNLMMNYFRVNPQ